jgi:hypothetical protein
MPDAESTESRIQACRRFISNTAGSTKSEIRLIARFTTREESPARAAARGNSSGVRQLSTSGKPALRASAE